MPKAVRTEACLESLKEKIRSAVAISEADLDAIAGHFECRLIEKDKLLLQEGNRCDVWGFVHSGLLRVYTHKSNGDEYTSWFIKENEFFSEFVSFFSKVPSLESLAALEDTAIVTVDADTLQKLIDRYPVFDKFVRLIYQATIINIKESMLYKLHLTAQERYLRFMQTRPDIVQRVPLKHIATYIDITESTLSRIRRKIMVTK